ncbi:MAG: DUF4388 domain-containing protein [Deltaproteobacteria bacterium]|nr:DUF4388 domain-containing protein [Deltaproteobacteria bacterium]
MPKTILVVDDSGNGLAGLSDALEHSGYDPTVLHAGDDPVVQFGLLKPEIVFLNLREPTAVEICQGIRDNPDGAIVPVILVGSGQEAVRSPSDALTQGGDYYFSTPLEMNKVLAKVQTYVGAGTSAVEAEAPKASDQRVPPPGLAPLPPIPEEVTQPVRVLPAAPPPPAAPAPFVPPPAPVGLPSFSWDKSTTAPGDDAALAEASDALLATIGAGDREVTKPHAAIPEALRPEAAAGAPDTEAVDAGVADESALEDGAEDALRLKEEQELQQKLTAQKAADAENARRAAEAQRQAEREAEARAAEALRQKAEEEARLKAEAELLRRAEEEAKRRVEEELRRKAEEEARQKVEEEARRRAEEDARRRAEEEARQKVEEEARRKAEEDARRRVEEEARQKVEEEARRKAEEEARRKAEEEARRKAEEEARRKAEEEARRKAEEEARRKAEEEARRKAEEEARRKVEEEARRKAEEEARRKAEEEARRKAEEEARRKAEEEARRKAEEEATREAEVRRQVEAEVRRKMGLGDQPVLPVEAPVARPDAKGPPRRERLPIEQAPAPAAPVAWAQPAIAAQASKPGGLAPLSALSPAEGPFGGQQDIAWLMQVVAAQQVTGRIDFASDNRKKTLFVERGGPVDAYSSQVFDRMEEYLYREGKITRAQYQDVRVKGLRNPRKIGAYLVSEGFMKPEELFATVRGYLMEVAFGLFEWEAGTYAYLPERVEEDDRITLDVDPRAMIVEGIRRKYLLPRLMQRLGAPSTLLVPKEGVAPTPDVWGLSADERQVLRLLDGTRSIEDLVFSTGLSAQRVYQVLTALVALDYAEIRVRGIEGVDADGASAGDEIDRRRIHEKVEQVRKLDYFQILGVQQAATTYEIDRAYERMLADFKAERFSSAVNRELAEQLLEIARVFDDAREVLKNDALRAAYARHIG